MIVIIDYGMGNLRSVLKAFQRIKSEVIISSDLREIEKADKLILPGVGHFKQGMQNLKENGLTNLLTEKVIIKKTPILGICLGMQIMTKHSEEGDVDGLGWIDASTIKFNFYSINEKLKIPHIGWNSVEKTKDCCLLDHFNNNNSFYFVHSYYVICNDDSIDKGKTNYGINFSSVFNKDNIYGVQFHPEKSHDAGIELLQKFISL